MVHFTSETEMTAFMLRLQRAQFENVGSTSSYYRHVLVNLVFKRFAIIEKACKYSCVDDRVYEEEEFLNEVYGPWQRHEGIDFSSTIIEMDGDEYVMALMSNALLTQFDEEHEKLMDACRAAAEAKQPMPDRHGITALPAEYKVGARTLMRLRYTVNYFIF